MICTSLRVSFCETGSASQVQGALPLCRAQSPQLPALLRAASHQQALHSRSVPADAKGRTHSVHGCTPHPAHLSLSTRTRSTAPLSAKASQLLTQARAPAMAAKAATTSCWTSVRPSGASAEATEVVLRLPPERKAGLRRGVCRCCWLSGLHGGDCGWCSCAVQAAEACVARVSRVCGSPSAAGAGRSARRMVWQESAT